MLYIINVQHDAFTVIPAASRAEWLEARRPYIGASDTPAIMGCDDFRSRLEVYADKLGRIDRPAGEAAIVGLELEPVLLWWFSRRLGRRLKRNTSLHASNRYPWMACTPDAFDEHGVPYQVKVTSRAGWGVDQLPDYVWWQVQHEQVVLGADESHVVALTYAPWGGGLLPRELHIPADAAAHRRVIEATQEFWELLIAETPPDPDGSTSSAAALAALHPSDDGSTIDLSGDAERITKRLRRLDRAHARIRAEREKLRQKIKAALGDAREGRLPDGSRWVLSTSSREPPRRSLRFKRPPREDQLCPH